MVSVAQMVGVCIVRNGERCKDCMFYGKPCSNYKARHKGKKPMDVDENKAQEQRRFFHHETN